MHRSLLLLLLGALCAAAASLIDEPDADRRLERASARLEQRIGQAQAELDRAVEEQLARAASLGPRQWLVQEADALERERTGTELVLLAQDTVAAWTGDASGLLGAATGIGLRSEAAVGSLRMRGWRPVWLEPPVHNRFLRERFHPSLHADDGLVAVAPPRPGRDIALGASGRTLRLAWHEGAMELGPWLAWRGAFLALAAAFLLASAWAGCGLLLRRGKALQAALAFVAALLALRWLSLALGPTPPLDRWPLFDPAIYASGWWFPSLGDLLINAALMALAAAFLLRAAASAPPIRGRGALPLLFMLPLAHAAGTTALIRGLVTNSSLDLDLYHIQGLGAYGALALLTVALLMGGWCLAALAALRLVPDDARNRIGSAAIAAAASAAIHHLLGVRDTVLFLWPLPALFLLYGSRTGRLGLLAGVLLLAVLAGASTHIITRHMDRRERTERVVLAERLALREDPVLEQLFREAAPAMRRDAGLYRLIAGGGYCDPADLVRLVKQPYFSGYWDRYDLRLFAYDSRGELRCATDPEPPLGLPGGPAQFPSGVSDMPDLFTDERIGGELYYHARIAVMPSDSAPPVQLVVELKPRSLSQGAGFPDLLLAGDDEVARRTERYSQARYVDGLLMHGRGSAAHPQRWDRPLRDEVWFQENGEDRLAKAVSERVVMVLGLPQRTLLDRVTTFSYLFTLFGLLLLLALGARAAANGGLRSLGIGTKVRSALVLFAVAGLVLFGYGSQRLLSRQFEEREAAASLEKARAAAQELQRRIGDERIDREAYAGYLGYVLGQLGNAYFTDLTLYAPDGRWLASTRPQMLTQGLLGPRMEHCAFMRLADRGESAFVHQEHVGAAAFRTAYLPVLDSQGDRLAFLALPSFADQAQQDEERAQLLVAVVNLFVLLFALSVVLAVVISKWTTQPLDVLKRALAGVALDGANEPIHYRGKDEVGELVAVYNRKVEELRESAERLARSERESAWREMARQVAHEVKNPLTPMKLGIQHFQATWDPHAPDARERLDRFAKGMVEQIDALNGVASAFSQFAQMPAPAPTRIDLCEVVRAAVDVFRAAPGVAIAHREQGPLIVLADREHMLRAINNLLTNAVQAMPDGRAGRIEVEVRQEGGSAVAEVRDNGSGIPEEARERIFTPSFTTKSGGMGLGLAMVKRMVEGAGGRVRFESEEGVGTSVFVELPLAGAQG